MKMKNYYVLVALMSSAFSCMFAAQQQNGIMANVGGVTVNPPRVDNNVMQQAYSSTMSIINSPAQTKKMISKKAFKKANNIMGYDNRTQCSVQKILAHAAEKEIRKMELQIDHICNQIDKNMDFPEDCFLLPFIIGSRYLAVCPESKSSASYAIEKLQEIESYIPAEFSSQAIYHNLTERHPYFEFFIDNVVDEEVEQFKNAEDVVRDLKKVIPGLSRPLSEFIKRRAQEMNKDGKEVNKEGRGMTGYLGNCFIMLAVLLIIL